MDTLRLLTLYNFLSDTLDLFADYAKRSLHRMTHSLLGLSNNWYFLNASNIPLSSLYCDRVDQEDIDWTYNHDTYTLNAEGSDHHYKLPWLSASLTIYGEEYSLDDWYPRLNIRPSAHTPDLNPARIAACWSIHNHVWAHVDPEASLTIVDQHGAVHDVSLYADYDEEVWLDLVQLRQVEEEEEEEEEEEGEEEEAAVTEAVEAVEAVTAEAVTAEAVTEAAVTEAVTEAAAVEEGESTDEGEGTEATDATEEEDLQTSDGCPLVPLITHLSVVQ